MRKNKNDMSMFTWDGFWREVGTHQHIVSNLRFSWPNFRTGVKKAIQGLWLCSPFKVVGPSGSCADYRCNGADDHVAINEAMSVLQADWWGKIYILACNYVLWSYILRYPNVTVECLWIVTFTTTGNSEMLINTQDLGSVRWYWWVFDQAGVAADKQCIRIDWWYDVWIYGMQTINASHHAIRLTDLHRFTVQETYNSAPWLVNLLHWCGIVMFSCDKWSIHWNGTYNTAYHGIQCHNDCTDINIYDNVCDDTGNVNTAWSGIQAQSNSNRINVRGNTTTNVSWSGINLDDTTNSKVHNNTVDSTTLTAWILINGACSNVAVDNNDIIWASYWVKVDTWSSVSVDSNRIFNPTINWIYVLWGATLYGSVSGNDITWMAWGATAGIQFEGVGTGHANVSDNFVQWARYVARFAVGTTNCNLTGNTGKITSLATYTQGIRDDSGGATITVDASNIAYT